MQRFSRHILVFSKRESLLWGASVLLIVVSFILFDRTQYMTLIASLIGVTSLVYNAKGLPFGQLLMIVFSVLYGVISFRCAYYGEMATYLGMTAPMALLSLITWLRHPHSTTSHEVAVNRLSHKELLGMVCISIPVTVAFYFLLRAFDTANLIPSTISVTTSFIAAYLTARRSPYFALAYAANDIVLIVLWVLASLADRRYLSVTVCFIVFLVFDLYGFISWQRMERRQQQSREK